MSLEKHSASMQLEDLNRYKSGKILAWNLHTVSKDSLSTYEKAALTQSLCDKYGMLQRQYS